MGGSRGFPGSHTSWGGVGAGVGGGAVSRCSERMLQPHALDEEADLEPGVP